MEWVALAGTVEGEAADWIALDWIEVEKLGET